MPGNNLSSHAWSHELALTHLQLDLIVVCMTLPNHLAENDLQTARSPERGLGNRLIAWGVGRGVADLWVVTRPTKRARSSSDAVIAAFLRRLAAQATTAGHAPPLVYSFAPFVAPLAVTDPQWPPLFGACEDVTTDSFPRDGHPNPSGARRHAPRIAAALALAWPTTAPAPTHHNLGAALDCVAPATGVDALGHLRVGMPMGRGWTLREIVAGGGHARLRWTRAGQTARL